MISCTQQDGGQSSTLWEVIFPFYRGGNSNLLKTSPGRLEIRLKEPTCQCRRPRFDPWVRRILWRRAWPPTSVLLPGESHGLYSPWGLKEQLFFTSFLSQLYPKVSPYINIISPYFFCLVYLQYLFSKDCLCFYQASQGESLAWIQFYVNFLAWCFYITMLVKILSQDFKFLKSFKFLFLFFIQSSSRRKLFFISRRIPSQFFYFNSMVLVLYKC